MTPEEFEDWLKDRDPEILLVIIFRIAARVWPLTVLPDDRQTTAFPCARALLILHMGHSGGLGGNDGDAVVATMNALTATVTDAAKFATFVVTAAMDAAMDAATITEVDTARSAAGAAAVYAEGAVEDVGGAVGATGAALQFDCEYIETHGADALLQLPLWSDARNPLQENWQTAHAMLGQTPDFTFWVRWYNALLAGTPVNRAMLSEIALLPSDDWGKGPKHMAQRIAEVELRHIQAATPLAERVEWVPDIQRIRITPVPMENTALWNTVLDKLRDALADIRPAGTLANAHAALSETLTKLDRTLERYADNPQRVHDDMAGALWRTRQLVRTGEIADDPRAGVFMRVLDENILDIEGNVPEVLETVQKRAALRFAGLSGQDKQTLIDTTDVIVPYLEKDRIQSDMNADAETLRDETPDPDSENYRTVLYRWVGRASRSIPILLKKIADIGKKIAIGTLIGTLIEILSTFF